MLVMYRLLLNIVCIRLTHCIVTLKPNTTNNDINVYLTPDNRISNFSIGFEPNGIYDNKWRINYKYDGLSLSDWYEQLYLTHLTVF